MEKILLKEVSAKNLHPGDIIFDVDPIHYNNWVKFQVISLDKDNDELRLKQIESNGDGNVYSSNKGYTPFPINGMGGWYKEIN